MNSNTVEYTSWSFRCAPGFFDIVTYNGNRATPKTIPHNLQSKPGCILIKSTDNSGYSWCVYHQELDIDEYMFLNTTSQAQSGDAWNNTEPTSSNFSIGSIGNVNNGTSPYIAYLFADTDEKIKCGAYDGTGTSNNVVNVGFKPEWVMIKCVGDVSGNWMLMDRQRGTSGVTANSSDRDINYGGIFEWTDTGFTLGSTNNNFNADTQKYIYVAIAENLDAGQKLPSKAAFSTTLYTGNRVVGREVLTGINNTNKSLVWVKDRDAANNNMLVDSERGNGIFLNTENTSAQSDSANPATSIQLTDDGFTCGTTGGGVDARINDSPNKYVAWNFRGAPKFL